MTENEMDLSKVLWCEKCGRIELDINSSICIQCGESMIQIGSVEDKVKKINYSVGGSLKQKICGCGRPTVLKGYDSQGRPHYRDRCGSCRYYGQKAKDKYCASCGVIPKNQGMLEVDHIDNNPSNNDKENLQTLCKPCHILKTIENKDWIKNDKKTMC